jgi:uncharacterized protein (TIGR03437 family)
MKTVAAFLFFGLLLHGASEGPQVWADQIVNAADSSGGRVAPGEIVTVFASHTGPAILAGQQLDRQGKVTTLLGATRVLFDGIPAPLSSTVTGRVSAVVPYEVAGKRTTHVVVEYQGVQSSPVTVLVADSVPAIFTLDSTGQGQVGMLNETVCCNSPRNPAMPGSVVALWATGAGMTNPPSIDGNISAYSKTSGYPVPHLPVHVTVGGEPAEITYAAAAPHAVAGLLQVNFRIPAKAPVGDAIPVVLNIGNFRSTPKATMAVRSAQRQILLIEADPSVLTQLRNTLSAAGYRVLASSSGADARRQAGAQTIDLAVLSLALPERERSDLLQVLRSDRPRLMLVARARSLDPAALREADLLGAQAVISQSTAPAEMLRRIRELLRSRPVPYVSDERPVLSPSGGVSR